MSVMVRHEPSGWVALAIHISVFMPSETLNGIQLLDRENALKLIDGLASFYNSFSQEQIDAINARILDSIRVERAKEKQREHELNCRNADLIDGPGVVYLLTRLDGLVKIGFTRSMPQRYKDLCREHGKLEQTHLFSTRWPRYGEARLHYVFRDKRVEGEWFRLTPADIEEIKKIDENTHSQWLEIGTTVDIMDFEEILDE